MGIKIPFGLRDQKLWHISDVQNGNACGCVCPKCRTPLQARNNPKNKKIAHFAHTTSADCTYNGMTDLHKMAQQILFETKTMLLPPFKITPELELDDGSYLTGEPIALPGQKIVANNAYLEYRWKNYVIDVMFEVEQDPFFIEVAVEHLVELSKEKAVKINGVPTFELRLQDVRETYLFDKDFLYELVSNPKENGIWIHHPEGERLLTAAIDELKIQSIEKNEEIAKRKLEAEISLREEEAKEKLRQNLRDTIQEDLSLLAKTSDYSWLGDRFGYLESLSVPKTAIEIFQKQWAESYKEAGSPITEAFPEEFLIGSFGGDWAIETHRSVWQNYIVMDILLPLYGDEKGVRIKEVTDQVVKKYGLLDFMARLHNIINSAESREEYWYLEDEEIMRIQDPHVPVRAYLWHLERIGFIKRQEEKYHVPHKTLDSYRENVNALKASAFENSKEEQLQLLWTLNEESFRFENLNADQQEAFIDEKSERVRFLAASDRRVFQEGSGSGFMCIKCQFSLLETDTPCPFCGEEKRVDHRVEKYQIANLNNSIRCGVRPRRSCIAIPEITTYLLDKYICIHSKGE